MASRHDDFEVPRLGNNPTPEEHAEYVIMRLEQFIRDGRTIDEGMSFKKWQTMAKTEIALAIAEAENSQDHDEISSRRTLFVSAAAMITIGFWGTAVSLHKVAELIGGLVILTAGIIMLMTAGGFRYRKYKNRKDGLKRALRLTRIESLNRRIKQLEQELEKELKEKGKQLDKVRKPHGTSLYDMFMQDS
jgi:hypothetical protein